MIKGFIEKAKEYFKSNLIAIALYGSRIWGFAGKKSDYDLFVFLKKEVNKKEVIKQFKKFKKINFAYILTFPELKEKIREGSWASYIVLLKASKILYGKREYNKLLSWLRNFKISKIKIKEKYLKRNEHEIRETKTWREWKATKWITINIGKRLQILTYFRFNILEPRFLKNLKTNKNLLTGGEYSLALRLYRKMMKREKIGRDRKKAILLFKKVHNLCKKF